MVVTYQKMYNMERFLFEELYRMPVRLREFYYRFALKRQEDERRAHEKAQGISEGTPVSKKEAGQVPGFVKNQVSAR